MFIDSRLLYNLQLEVVQTAVYLQNRTLVQGEEQTLEKLQTSTKLSVAYLKAFRCDAYTLTSKKHQDEENKIYKNSQKCLIIEYSETISHYHLQNLKSKKTIVATSVIFNEDKATSAASLLELLDENPIEACTQYTRYSSTANAHSKREEV